jgi:hypothetical protein
MLSLPQICRCLTLCFCVALVSCAPLNKYSYETFRPNPKHDNYPAKGTARSDLLALVYADYVAKLLEGRSTGARITREISDSTLAIGGTLAGAQETLGITAETVARMGVGIVIIRELQGIFNARGRSEAFADAAYLVRQAQAEYRAFNPNPPSDIMTENGATLVRRVDSAVHAARKTLIGRMPSLLDLKQATQPMTEDGATKTEAGPTNQLETARGDALLPQGVTKEDVRDAVAAEVKKIPRLQPGDGGKVTIVPIKQGDFQKRVGVQTLALKSLEDAAVEKVYEEIYSALPTLPGQTKRTTIHADLIGIKKTPASADGTIPQAAVKLLEKYETAIKNQAP